MIKIEQLLEVIQLVSKKYASEVTTVLNEKSLTLEYSYYINNKQTFYEILTVKEFDKQLEFKMLFGNAIKITDLKGIEEMIITLRRKSKTEELLLEEVEYLKQKYIAGTKIELIQMPDVHAPAPGTVGVVKFVDDLGTIHVNWNNGSTLGLIVGVDEFKIIK